jgi:8-oxo-dGTP pyrophosphatase MutT (NUDIX family)
MRAQARELLSGLQPTLVTSDAHMPAAVMLLLYERDGAEHVLFQVRSHRVEHHKGEISLPGGARDEDDESLLHTALRETHEEIGVPPDHIEVYGRLDDVVTRSNFVMSPFVGAITEPAPYPFRFARVEVDRLLEVPVPYLLSGDGWETMTAPNGMQMRAYRYGEDLIFGATARVLGQFLELLQPGHRAL